MDNALKVHEQFLKKQEQQIQKFATRRDAMIAKMDELDQSIRDLNQEQNAANNLLQAEFDAAFAEARAKDEEELLASREKENIAPAAKKAKAKNAA
jgi:hypothetical protein